MSKRRYSRSRSSTRRHRRRRGAARRGRESKMMHKVARSEVLRSHKYPMRIAHYATTLENLVSNTWYYDFFDGGTFQQICNNNAYIRALFLHGIRLNFTITNACQCEVPTNFFFYIAIVKNKMDNINDLEAAYYNNEYGVVDYNSLPEDPSKVKYPLSKNQKVLWQKVYHLKPIYENNQCTYTVKKYVSVRKTWNVNFNSSNGTLNPNYGIIYHMQPATYDAALEQWIEPEDAYFNYNIKWYVHLMT